jgi:quercetin dioxygenase-like cupin family protein
VPIEQEPQHHLVIENEFVRAFAVEIAPHDRTLCHHHPNDYLLYVAGDGDIVSAARDEEPKQLIYRDGECELLEAGMVHVVENLGDTAFRNVVVELLPGASSLRRGREPKVTKGELNVTQLLDDARAAIFEAVMESEAEVVVSGPAVVATPYGDRLAHGDLGQVMLTPNSISNLTWIPPGQQEILRRWQNAGDRALIFQVGRAHDQLLPVEKRGDPRRVLRAHAEEGE